MDMISFIVHLNVQFTDEEKESCLPTVERMVELAHQARQKGLLSYEVNAANENDIFMKTVLSYMVDGLDLRSLEEAMQVMILGGNYKGAELLKRLIIVMGARSILHGDNPRIVHCFLLSMLGEKYQKDITTVTDEEKRENVHTIRGFLDNLDAKDFSETGKNEFESLLLSMNDASIQRVFFEISPFEFSQYMPKALGGTKNYYIWNKVLYNLSKNMQLELIEDYKAWQDFIASSAAYATDETVKATRAESNAVAEKAAQQRIVDVIRKLEDEGELIIWSKQKHTL